jgi:hypothetical protein
MKIQFQVGFSVNSRTNREAYVHRKFIKYKERHRVGISVGKLTGFEVSHEEGRMEEMNKSAQHVCVFPQQEFGPTSRSLLMNDFHDPL